MRDKRETDREELLKNLKVVATTEKESESYRSAKKEARGLLEALETSRVLDPEALKRPVNI